MKAHLTIAVRNPDWFWTKDQLDEARDYRKEWEALNEDKVPKFVPSETLEVAFDVEEIIDNRHTSFEIPLKSKNGDIATCNLEDLTVVEFRGKIDTWKAAVSNSLIHQYMGARKQEYKLYVYFYIKENVRFHQVAPGIWISEAHKQILEDFISSR